LLSGRDWRNVIINKMDMPSGFFDSEDEPEPLSPSTALILSKILSVEREKNEDEF
jgi:hypothetical protein